MSQTTEWSDFACRFQVISQCNGPILATTWECSPLVRAHAFHCYEQTDDLLKGIFDLGIEKTEGKTYLALGPQITPTGMAEVFTKVTGKQAVHEPISFEEFGELSSALVGPAFKEDAIEMMQWAAIAPSNRACYGALEAETEKVNEELGVVASTFEEWLRRSGWTGP